jgi:hypothetical protein
VHYFTTLPASGDSRIMNSKGSGRTDRGLIAVRTRHLPGDTAEQDEDGQS